MCKKTMYLMLVIAVLQSSLHAQDIHFSQFYASPLTLNPAMTGYFDGNYRLSSNYKNQWGSVSSPFKTIAAAVDANFFKDSKKLGFMGVGLSFYSDKAGTSNMGLTSIALSCAYTLHLNRDNTFGLGIQGGFTQMSINPTLLKWDEQFSNGHFDPNRPSEEAFATENISYIDLAGGILWKYLSTQGVNVSTGIAFFHAGKQELSFMRDGNSRQNVKLVFHQAFQVPLKGTNYSLIPYVLLMQQAKNREYNIGGLFKYDYGLGSSSFYLGGFYRIGDAVILTTFLNLSNRVSLGLSYDLNTSGLSAASNAKGGIEISITYTAFRQKMKPSFIQKCFTF